MIGGDNIKLEQLDYMKSIIDTASSKLSKSEYGIVECAIHDYEAIIGVNKYKWYKDREDGINKYFMDNVMKMVAMLPSRRVLERFVKNVGIHMDKFPEFARNGQALVFALNVVQNEVNRNALKNSVKDSSVKKDCGDADMVYSKVGLIKTELEAMTKGLMSFNLTDKLNSALKNYEKHVHMDYLRQCYDVSEYFNQYIMPMISILPNAHAEILQAIYNDSGGDGDEDVQDRLANVVNIAVQEHVDMCNISKKKGQGKKSMKKSFEGMFEGVMEKMMPKRVEDGEVAITMNGGLAVRRADGDYVSYDANSGKIVNSMKFVINNDTVNKFIFLMPMAQLQVGDIIKNNKTYYYVREIYDGGVKVISLNSGAHSNMVEETNIMFGTTLYSKVVSLFNMVGCQQTTGGMFGQVNPMMLMLMMDKSEDGEGGDMSDMLETMLMMQMFSGGQNMFGGMFNGLGGMQNK